MIENALLKYLGIYPEAIERADAICERVCYKFGIDSDVEVWPAVLSEFEDATGFAPSGHWTFTNVLVSTSFRILMSALAERGISDERIDVYVDGMCSSFAIDGNEQ